MTGGIDVVFHRNRNGIGQLGQPTTAYLVIGVNDRLTIVMRGKELPFSGFIALHVAMVVQMVAAQVGERTGGKGQRRNTVLHQTVRRDFHRGKSCALIGQSAQHLLNIHGGTGGIFGRTDFAQ